jgi:hypothetical protein
MPRQGEGKFDLREGAMVGLWWLERITRGTHGTVCAKTQETRKSRRLGAESGGMPEKPAEKRAPMQANQAKSRAPFFKDDRLA